MSSQGVSVSRNRFLVNPDNGGEPVTENPHYIQIKEKQVKGSYYLGLEMNDGPSYVEIKDNALI